MADTIIWHKPECGTSHNVVGSICNAAIEPQIRDCRKNPPDDGELRAGLQATGSGPRDLSRGKGAPCDDPGSASPQLCDADLIAAIQAHPVLIERPLVFTHKGVVLHHPSPCVLPQFLPQKGAFRNEAGDMVGQENGQPVTG